MEKNRWKKWISVILTAVLVFGMIPFTGGTEKIEAATKVSKCRITLAKTTYTYTKKVIKPKATVKFRSKKLKNIKNYTVTYKNNKKVGTATVIIKGKGSYKGKVSKKFQIVPKLSKTKVSVVVGKTYTLKATSSAKVKFKSSNASVAKVNSKGVITGRKEGTATITVTSNKVKNTCKVTVVKGVADFRDKVNPSEVNYALSDTDKTINVGDNTASIRINNYTGDNVTAVSSNEALIHAAYIGGGKIELYAHAAGTAVVTVMVEGRTLVCNITSVMPDGRSNNGDNESGNNGGISGRDLSYGRLSSGELYMRCGDAESIGRIDDFAKRTVVSYESSDTSVATVIPWDESIPTQGFGATEKNEYYVQAIGEGKATITITAADGTRGCADVIVWGSGFTVSDTSASAYSTTVDSVTAGSFTYGQRASSVIGAGDLETTYGEKYNHPSGLAYYKTGSTVYFVVTDAWNNRVFIYTGTSIAEATGRAPAIILGQQNVNSCRPGYTLSEMNWPMDCAVDQTNGRLYVADTHNNRILVYDDITKLTTGAAADHSIEWFSSDHTTHLNHMYWPWSVSTDYEGKLIVASTLLSNVLVWDEIPDTWEEADANYYPDMIMNMGNTTTPRTLTWTGKQLIIGDENVPGMGNGLYVLNGFPTRESLKRLADAGGDDISYAENTITYTAGGSSVDKTQTVVKVETIGNAYIADTVLPGGYGEGCTIDGKLYIAYASCIRTWTDGTIDNESDTGDVYTNQRRENTFAEDGGVFLNGGGLWKTIYAEGNLYMALHNANKLIGWSGVGTSTGKLDTSSVTAYQRTSQPDIEIGNKGGVIHNPIPVTDGKHLIVLDDLGQSIYVYQGIPTSSGAEPDYIYATPYEIGDAALHTYTDNDGTKEAFIVTSRTQNIIYVWKDYKFDGTMPDVVIGKNIGSKYFSKEMEYIEFDGTYTYISTYVDGEYMVLIYRGLPEKGSEPVGSIKGIDNATDISSNGTYISVVNRNNDTGNSEIWIYQTAQLAYASEESPVTLTRTQASVIDSINIGETPTESNDGDEYGGCIDQHFNIYNVEIDNKIYKRHERTTLNGVYAVLATDDGKLIASDMSDDRVIIWNRITDAIEGGTPTIIGHGANMYDYDDMIGVSGAHDIQEAIFADTLSMPRYLAYDGKNLWVGEFKFSNRLLRYALQ